MKILHYDPEQDLIKSYSVNRFKLILMPIIAIGALLIFGLGFAGIYMQYQENSTIRSLKRQNQYMVGILNRMQSKTSTIQSQINKIKNQSIRLSEYAQLPVTELNDYEIGSGGTEYSVAMDDYITNESVKNQIKTTSFALDQFKKQISWLYADLNSVEDKFALEKDLRRHLPSIRPVQNGILTSRYGHRLDPFTQQKRHHNGLDFFAKAGTPVIAPADGIVVIARNNYSPNQTLGKLIILDHGHGIKTKFGHLGKLLVKHGQKVSRHEVIGYVGNSGRSTGPHLHYEVVKERRYKNPEYFILD